MQALAVRTQLRRRFDSHDRVAEGGQGRGIAPGAGADIEDAARRRGKERQDLAMNVGEGHALVRLHQRIGGFAVAFGATGCHAADYIAARACLAASKAARRWANLPSAGPAAAAIEGAGSVS